MEGASAAIMIHHNFRKGRSLRWKTTFLNKNELIERTVESHQLENEKHFESTLRPLCFEDFPGQTQVKDKLKVFVSAAKKRREALDHTFALWPTRLGKNHLSSNYCRRDGCGISLHFCACYREKGDLAALLTSLKPFSVLFYRRNSSSKSRVGRVFVHGHGRLFYRYYDRGGLGRSEYEI